MKRLMNHSNLYMKARKRLNRTPFTNSLVSKNNNGKDNFPSINIISRLLKGTGLRGVLKLDHPNNLLLLHPTNSKYHISASLIVHLAKNPNSTFDFISPLLQDHHTRLAPFYHNWQRISKDNWVLNIIRFGYRLELVELPPLGHLQVTTSNPTLEEEVLTLLQKNAI